MDMTRDALTLSTSPTLYSQCPYLSHTESPNDFHIPALDPQKY